MSVRGKKPAKPDAENGPYLKSAYFYDPFIKLSWSLIKMSEFPMKHLKISSMFHSKITHQQTICGSRKVPKRLLRNPTMIQHDRIVRSVSLNPTTKGKAR